MHTLSDRIVINAFHGSVAYTDATRGDKTAYTLYLMNDADAETLDSWTRDSQYYVSGVVVDGPNTAWVRVSRDSHVSNLVVDGSVVRTFDQDTVVRLHKQRGGTVLASLMALEVITYFGKAENIMTPGFREASRRSLVWTKS